MATKSEGKKEQFKETERVSNGFCRYYARGDCREGNDCKYSHAPYDVPICRYYLEDRCMFGSDCWYKHAEPNMENVGTMAAVLGAGLMCGVGANVNLLLAAAIAGTATPTTPENSQESDDEKEKEDVSLDKVLEMWKKHNKKEKDKNNNNSSTDSNENDNKDNDESDENGDSSYDDEEMEEGLQEFSKELKRYSIASWGVDDMYKLVTTLAKLDLEEFDEYDIITSKILGDSIRAWKSEPQKTAELFMKITEDAKTDLTALILTLCNAPNKVSNMERHIASVVLAAQKRDPKSWTSVAVGKLLQTIEENGFDVDVIDMFYGIGKEVGDAVKVGELVHDYLLATGDRDSFDCRCKTAECQCPILADEGVAFLVFSGLQRKLDWGEEEKIKFFKKATGTLWPPEVLKELGDIFGIKDPLKVGTPRNLKSRQKIREVSDLECKELAAPDNMKRKNKSRKCYGVGCPNQSKRECDNEMCGKCCRKSGEPCDVHEDFEVYVAPEWETSTKFGRVEPSVRFVSKEQFESFTSLKRQMRRVEFGGDFSVKDDHVTKVVDLWSDNLVVLEMGSSDSGCGSQLTDAAVKYIAEHCPNLRKLRLESATRVSDDGVCEIINKCRSLEDLHVSGNDKSTGNLSSKSLKLLFEPSVLPNLKQLCVYDQYRIDHDVVYRLRRRRPKIKIHAGETDSDSFAHSMVLSMMGMSYGDGFY